VKRVFGPKEKEEAGGLFNMHDETLHDLQSSSTIRMTETEMMGWGRNLSRLLG
jgi:hypothetical protein